MHSSPTGPASVSAALGPRRVRLGFLVAAGLLAVVTPVLVLLRAAVTLPGDVAVYLLLVIVTSLVGGFFPALACAVFGGLVLNFFLVPPLYTLAIERPDDVVAVVIFLIAGVLVSRVVDISAHRAALAERAEVLAENLAQNERTRTALLNAVSHDLRTPIASAKTAISGLRQDDVPFSAADRAELLATADQALDRLTDLVTNLLDLSRLQAGVLPVRLEPVGVDEVVATALAHLPVAPVRVELPADLPDVLADAGLLERVVANLVQNAIRYAPDGEPVRIIAGVDGSEVVLRVVDHGRGIDPADWQRVFAAFQRSGDASVDGAGVGLGLAIVRGFVEAMGGAVAVSRTAGGGATMLVTLPMAAAGERV